MHIPSSFHCLLSHDTHFARYRFVYFCVFNYHYLHALFEQEWGKITIIAAVFQYDSVQSSSCVSVRQSGSKVFQKGKPCKTLITCKKCDLRKWTFADKSNVIDNFFLFPIFGVLCDDQHAEEHSRTHMNNNSKEKTRYRINNFITQLKMFVDIDIRTLILYTFSITS